jgi:peptidoglycan/LPS O-acetylase OafA/YrhL
MQSKADMPRKFYRPELDLVRLLAFLLVFVHHTLSQSSLPQLRLLALSSASGMQIFFLLSSYLITELMLREIKTTGTVHVRAFFVRRILRIWPLYFVFVIAYLVYSLATHASPKVIHGLIAFLLVSGNWYTALYGFLPNVISPLWSISLEEQFYVLWPVTVRFGKQRAIWFLSVISIIASYLALLYLGDGHHTYAAVWANGFVEFQFFGLGAMLAILLHKNSFQLPLWIRPLLFAFAVLAIGVAQKDFHFVGYDDLLARTLIPAYLLLASGVVACFLSINGLAVPKAFAPLLYLGRISYGLYVFHRLAYACVDPFTSEHFAGTTLALIRLSATLALTIAFASVSYYLLERPFLKLKSRFTFVVSRAD